MAKRIKDLNVNVDSPSYEMVDERTIKTYNNENKMWVTMKFSNEENNHDGINHLKEILRENFIDSFS